MTFVGEQIDNPMTFCIWCYSCQSHEASAEKLSQWTHENLELTASHPAGRDENGSPKGD